MKSFSSALLALLLLASVVLTLTKPAAEIATTLTLTAYELRFVSLGIRIAAACLLIAGLVSRPLRLRLWASLIVLLAASAAVVATAYRMWPTVFFFGVLLYGTFTSAWRRELTFVGSSRRASTRAMAGVALLSGFVYPHWVAHPIWLNALLSAPLGLVNCPTLVAIGGLLLLADRPRPRFLTGFTAALNIYFGLFGLVRLSAYIDVILLATGTLLLVQLLCDRRRTVM